MLKKLQTKETRSETHHETEMLIYLLSCAMKDIAPDKERLKNLDLEELYHLSEKHLLTAMVGFALEKADIYSDKFIQAKGKAVRKVTMMEIDKERLFQRLEDEKIWYMPLKGAVLKDIYPSLGMRQMSDYDILFDKQYAVRLREIMEELGFVCKRFGKAKDDIYIKKPVSHFEMHRELIDDLAENSVFYHYYIHVRDRLIQDEDNRYGYHFSHEDMYVYLLVHEYKHYASLGGTGLRSLVDTCIFLKTYEDILDTEYILQQCRKLGIADFEKINRSLSLKLFDGIPLSDKEKKMYSYFLSSGVYGTVENKIENSIMQKENGKSAYIFQRVFLPMDMVRIYHPFFYRHKILLPLLFVYRIFKSFTVSRHKVKKELTFLRKSKSEK